MKRILIPMLKYYPDFPSGSVRLAFDQAIYMAREGHEVWIVTQDSTHQQPEYSFRDQLHVLHYPSPEVGLFDPRRVNAHQLATQQVISRHIKGTIDLLHGHTLLSYDGALQLCGESTRTCYTVHSPVKPEMLAANRTSNTVQKVKNHISAQLLHRVERRCLQNSDVITSDSQYTRQMIGKLHSSELGERVQVIPGWVDLDRFQFVDDRPALKRKFGWSLEKPVLFTLRRLVPRNGLDRLIKALSIVKNSGLDFQMIIGGDGPLRTQLEALTTQLGLNDTVKFLGRISNEDLPLMYATADVFVLPTTDLECFGLIMLESFAAGRPVLATPVAAIPEVMNRIEPDWLTRDTSPIPEVMNRIEPDWLTRDTSPEAIAEHIIMYLNNELPLHDPMELRQFAETYYHSDYVIPELIQTALET